MRPYLISVLPVYLLMGASVAALSTGPVPRCEEGRTFVEPIPLHKRLPEQWEFWDKCDRFVGAPIVEYLITTNGATSERRILRSSGCEQADRELLCWLRKWIFRPAMCGGEPVPYRTTFSINWHPGSGYRTSEHCVPLGEVVSWPNGKADNAGKECSDVAEGFVRFNIRVSERGRATDVTLDVSSGHDRCDQAVSRLLSSATWRPCEALGLDSPCLVEYIAALPWKLANSRAASSPSGPTTSKEPPTAPSPRISTCASPASGTTAPGPTPLQGRGSTTTSTAGTHPASAGTRGPILWVSVVESTS